MGDGGWGMGGEAHLADCPQRVVHAFDVILRDANGKLQVVQHRLRLAVVGPGAHALEGHVHPVMYDDWDAPVPDVREDPAAPPVAG
jgi:hypothetical protein